ncbi:hypothetical protein OL548_01300 [Lysinibacillus sp. MHQ-1]|nr:hypothetical protein OL548_01300 [Lysinibacillus sp. MHQ-1]
MSTAVAFFGHPLIRGIFKSSNSRMHEALGKLLVAAARQEGLRQAIVENIDHGNLDAQLKNDETYPGTSTNKVLLCYSSGRYMDGTWL